MTPDVGIAQQQGRQYNKLKKTQHNPGMLTRYKDEAKNFGLQAKVHSKAEA